MRRYSQGGWLWWLDETSATEVSGTTEAGTAGSSTDSTRLDRRGDV